MKHQKRHQRSYHHDTFLDGNDARLPQHKQQHTKNDDDADDDDDPTTPLRSNFNPRGRSTTKNSTNNGPDFARERSADPPPNFKRIQKRHYSYTKASKTTSNGTSNGGSGGGRGGGGGGGSLQLSLDSHPDDESSTFLHRWANSRSVASRLLSYLRQYAIVIGYRFGVTAHGAREKMDSTKLALAGLAGLALLFMKVGMSDADMYTSSSAASAGGYNELSSSPMLGSSGSYSQYEPSIKGYQARSQVPIPIEYANFVELSVFADAVTMVRVHRQKALMMAQMAQQQQAQLEAEQEDLSSRRAVRRRRRLEDANANEASPEGEGGEAAAGEGDPIAQEKNSNDEEDEMMNAIDQSWEQIDQNNNPENEEEEKDGEGEGEEDEEKDKQPKRAAGLKVNHIPFFWHIPRAGGATVSTILATCHSLTQATSSFSLPAIYKRGNDETLASRFRDPKLYHVRTGGMQFVNVDLDSLEGIERAKNGQMIQKEMADVVAVPDVRLGSLLFGSGVNQIHEDGDESDDEFDKSDGTPKEYKGVLFAMFRHPIDRAVSWFYHKQSVRDSVHYDPSLEIYSLADWVNSPGYITDYMVRTLVGKIDANRAFQPPVPLTHDDLDAAKEILRRKCIVGLLEEKGESMKRFEKFFGWNAEVQRTSLFLLEGEATAEAVQAERWKQEFKDEECEDRLLHWKWENKNMHPMLEDAEEGTYGVAYNLLESKNRFDIELYMYAKQLFEEQFTQLGFDDDEV